MSNQDQEELQEWEQYANDETEVKIQNISEFGNENLRKIDAEEELRRQIELEAQKTKERNQQKVDKKRSDLKQQEQWDLTHKKLALSDAFGTIIDQKSKGSYLDKKRAEELQKAQDLQNMRDLLNGEFEQLIDKSHLRMLGLSQQPEYDDLYFLLHDYFAKLNVHSSTILDFVKSILIGMEEVFSSSIYDDIFNKLRKLNKSVLKAESDIIHGTNKQKVMNSKKQDIVSQSKQLEDQQFEPSNHENADYEQEEEQPDNGENQKSAQEKEEEEEEKKFQAQIQLELQQSKQRELEEKQRKKAYEERLKKIITLFNIDEFELNKDLEANFARLAGCLIILFEEKKKPELVKEFVLRLVTEASTEYNKNSLNSHDVEALVQKTKELFAKKSAKEKSQIQSEKTQIKSDNFGKDNAEFQQQQQFDQQNQNLDQGQGNELYDDDFM